MSITVAENAGFCFGVRRAVDCMDGLLRCGKAKIYTYGRLIHNDVYNRQLDKAGVSVIMDTAQAAAAAELCTPEAPAVVVIRAHGIESAASERLLSLAQSHPGFTVEDMTCPFVSRIQKIAEENSGDGKLFIVIGSREHPEVKGIISCIRGEYAVFSGSEELASFAFADTDTQKQVVMVAQTTQKLDEWKKCQQIIEKVYTNRLIFDTICNVTENRQTETAELSRRCDVMIVIGGRDSSNTAKLYEIAKGNCPDTRLIGCAEELCVDFSVKKSRIGIAAGASTPSGIIQEVVSKMNNEITAENFEQMLNDSFKTLNTGDTVRGTVTNISANEIHLDLGAKVTGVIMRDQITDDPAAKLEDMFHVGDEIDAFVIKVSDVEGMATLSKKRVDLIRNWQLIVDAYNSGAILEGKVVEAVRGGVLVLISGVKVFVPSRFSGLAKDADLSVLIGNTVKVKIVDINAERRHAYASIRAAASEHRHEIEEEFWNSIEIGKHYEGTVKNMTTYGAFVDIGGIDGMVHNTELSWKRIKHPSEVVSIGQKIDVYVKDFDREKGRISLGYKTDEMNNWYKFVADYHVGDTVKVKIVNMMPFGAFAEIIDGVDGLIHINQIAEKRIAKPSDVLTAGQEVDVKITAIDTEKQKVDLSIRALIEDKKASEEAAIKEEMSGYIAGTTDEAPADKQ